MENETNELHYLRAMKNNKHILNLFPPLEFRDYCFVRKTISWKELINYYKKIEGFIMTVCIVFLILLMK